MRSEFKVLWILALGVMIMSGLSSCNLFNDTDREGTFTMHAGNWHQSHGTYVFVNHSDHDIILTIDGETRTLGRPPHGAENSIDWRHTASTITVRYSPSNRVSHSFFASSDLVTFRNRD